MPPPALTAVFMLKVQSDTVRVPAPTMLLRMPAPSLTALFIVKVQLITVTSG